MAAFGQLVTGPPGAGKSTYCHGMHQFLTALDRPVHIINLDPAVLDPPYPCAVNITDLISLSEIMDEHSLGPNGAMLYAMEYLEANFDWLEDELGKLVDEEERGACYLIIDTPGQVELWTNHDSLKRIVGRLIKADYRASQHQLHFAHFPVTNALLSLQLFIYQTHTTSPTPRNTSQYSYSPFVPCSSSRFHTSTSSARWT